MGTLKALRGVPVVAFAAAALLLAVAGVVLASGGSSLNVCVPAKEGKGIVTPKGGVCKKGYALTEVNKEGPEGQQGPEGKEGKEGRAEPAIALRIRDVAPVETVASPASVEDPLSDSTWSQAAEEVDQLVGQITVGVPSRGQCSRGEGSPATVSIHVLLDGTLVSEFVTLNIAAETLTVPLEWKSPAGSSHWLLEPGANTIHTISVTAQDTCGNGGGNATAHFTIQSVNIDAIGAR